MSARLVCNRKLDEVNTYLGSRPSPPLELDSHICPPPPPLFSSVSLRFVSPSPEQQNQEMLKELKFGIGDGHLQYYLYNYSLVKELKPEEVGLVLL